MGEKTPWQFCPECGCAEIHYEEGEHKQCKECFQEWFSDIDYSSVVAANLNELRAALASHTSALAERDAEIARLKAENKRFGRALELIASAVSWVIDEDLNRPVEVAMDEEEMANIARGALQPVELPHA